jgi:RNA polymerase sigma-70 factor, ECF subfamily
MALPAAQHPADPDSDRALLARLCSGDERAFEAIFRVWYAPLVRFAHRIVADRSQAEEVVQDAMLAMWQKRERLHSHASAQAWLFRATRNRALNLVRHDAVVVREQPRLISSLRLAASDGMPDVDLALAEAELQTAIDAAVEALPPRCREVFILSRRHGMRQSEIAAALGISIKTVEAQMTNALRALRARLRPWLLRHDTRQ